MKSDNTLLYEYKNGDHKALDMLIEKYLYLAKLKLSAFNYDKKYEEDLLQMGYEKLIILIKNYANKEFNITLCQCLHSGLNSYYCTHIYMFNNEKEISSGIDCIYSDEDFIVNTETKEILKIIGDIIFKTDYFTFSEKMCLIAKYGLISGYTINNTKISNILNYSSERIRQKLEFAVKEFKKIFKYKIHYNLCQVSNDFDTDLFFFLQASEEIVIHFIKKLNTEQIDILKEVWGEDFKHLVNLNDISLSDDEILEYFNIMSNLHSEIINISDEQLLNITRYSGKTSCYCIKR